jgi:pimeloyl-ACP methyl ester carboxylesterase
MSDLKYEEVVMRDPRGPTTQEAEATYKRAPNLKVTGGNGVEYTYRSIGPDTRPVILLQHFRGNLDNWDPALVDQLASTRRLVAFDNVGVGGSSGRTPNSVHQMATEALTFLDALNMHEVDLLGFSIGSFVAQEMALQRPEAVARVVLASSAPQGASGMHGWAPEVIDAVGKPQPDGGGYVGAFYTQSAESRQAGMQSLQRMAGRTKDRDENTNWQTRVAQYDAVCAWGVPNHSLLSRVGAIKAPAFVANGDSDPMILPRYSYLLAGLIPDSKLKIYPDAAHGFLFQHYEEFGHDTLAFLSD